MAQNKARGIRFEKVHRTDAENTLNYNDRSLTRRTEKHFGLLVLVLKFWIMPLFPVAIVHNCITTQGTMWSSKDKIITSNFYVLLV